MGFPSGVKLGLNGKKSKEKTVQQTTLPSWVTDAARGNLSIANRLTDPFVQQAPPSMVAPFTADQQAGFGLTRDFATGSSPITQNDLGWSYYRGFADRGPYTMAKMGGIPQASGVSIAETPAMTPASIGSVQDIRAGRFTDADIYAYMNPYTQGVVDTSLADLQDAYVRTQSASNLTQAASGAFGGARHGIREAQVADDHLRNVARTTSGLRNQAFNTAAGLIQGDQNRALQAAQANQSAAQQRALQQAQLHQDARRHNADLTYQRALQQAQLNQQTATANANLQMQGRQADIDSRYRSDQQRLGAVQAMADSTQRAQQLHDQRILQNATLLNDIGTQQQQLRQAELDAPFRALEIRNSTLQGTPYPTTQTTTRKSKSGGFEFGFSK